MAEPQGDLIHLTLLGRACGSSSLSFESSLRLVELMKSWDLSAHAVQVLALIQVLAELESRDLEAAVADTKGAYDQAGATYRNTATAMVPDEMVKAQQDVQAGRQSLDAARKLLESRQQLFEEGALARRLVDEAAVAEAQARTSRHDDRGRRGRAEAREDATLQIEARG